MDGDEWDADFRGFGGLARMMYTNRRRVVEASTPFSF
jgi:hypothetical protein